MTDKILDMQREFFASGKTLDTGFRREQLIKLRDLTAKYEAEINDALYKDLRKCEFEAFTSETGFVTNDLNHIIKHLGKWTKPKKVRTPPAHLPGRSYIISEPVGVSLIIGPWNYPFQLIMSPLAGAMAAGNCAVLKPSELSPNTTQVIKRMINDNFPPEYVHVLEGGPEVTTELLKQNFDYVFFTGSTRVGKIVMQAAAENLTPVTLELGGKSPCIVLKDINPQEAARRIVWGKFLNAGQTCVAPDYMLIEKDILPAVMEAIKSYIAKFFGKDPKQSKDYGRIITDRHYTRLKEMLGDGTVHAGGGFDNAERYIEPTLLTDPDPESPLMNEEIFGPLFPVIPVDSAEEAVKYINDRAKPLALYVFSKDKAAVKDILSKTSSGGACVNDTVVHLATAHLPFGGVGDSGIGKYHGRYSFDTFSNKKGVMHRTFFKDVPLRYPPYGKTKLGIMKKIFRWIV